MPSENIVVLMPPKTDTVSSLGITPTKRRDGPVKTGDVWLEDKKDLEGAEGLWRIHDDLYDLTGYINSHPGGPQWLQLTKGTDITEAFEVHHFSDKPHQIIKKYHVRKALTRRNYPYTFKEDGFYKTVKKAVIEKMKTLPIEKMERHTAIMSDCLVAATFVTSVLALSLWSYSMAAIAGYFLASASTAGHNYIHKKDNFRMYYYSFSFMQVREWRIVHVLSHHLHTNSIIDMEIALLEPVLTYLPKNKNSYKALMLAPFHWIFSFHGQALERYVLLAKGMTSHLDLSDLVPFILPLTMYLFGGQTILATLWMWTLIILISSAYFEFVGVNGAHHHPDIFHDGDTPRPDMDWGLNQLDTVMDRKEVTGNSYLVLTNYGDHALHHLFPTLDHGVLHHMYPVFAKIVKDFNVEIRLVPSWEMMKGQFRQLFRQTPNPNPPNLLKKYY